MRLATPNPAMEWDGTGFPKRRYTGWFDPDIVGYQGEAILARLDDAAAKCFIGAGLTYRTRRNPLDPGVLVDDFQVRQTYNVNVDARMIRLFGLSLLWRFAVSKNEAAATVTLMQRTTEDIRRRIVSGDPGSSDEYPVYFAFFDNEQELMKIGPIKLPRRPFYRFFLDGVVCYVSHRRKPDNVRLVSPWFVRESRRDIDVLCLSSADSWHERLQAETGARLLDKHGDRWIRN